MGSVSCPSWRARLVFVRLVLSALLVMGCGSVTPAAKTVTKSAVRGFYEEVDGVDPALQDRVTQKVLDSPAVRDAAHDLAGSVLTGAVDGLTEAQRDGKVDALLEATLQAMRKEGDAAMGDFIGRFAKELGPVLRSLIRELVSSTSEALRQAAARDLPVILSAVLESSMRAFAVAASGASDQMRAQAKDFAEHDLGPLAGAVSQQVARQAVVGIREGVHEDLDLHDPQLRNGMREVGIGLAQGVAAGTPTSPFTTSFAVASFVLALLLFLAVCFVVSLWTRARENAKVIALLARKLDEHVPSGAERRRTA